MPNFLAVIGFLLSIAAAITRMVACHRAESEIVVRELVVRDDGAGTVRALATEDRVTLELGRASAPPAIRLAYQRDRGSAVASAHTTALWLFAAGWGGYTGWHASAPHVHADAIAQPREARVELETDQGVVELTAGPSFGLNVHPPYGALLRRMPQAVVAESQMFLLGRWQETGLCALASPKLGVELDASRGERFTTTTLEVRPTKSALSLWHGRPQLRLETGPKPAVVFTPGGIEP